MLGGKQEPAELTAVHSVSFVGLHLGAAHVLGGIGGDPAVDVGEAEVAAHCRQAPIDRRWRKAALFHRGAVHLDVSPGCSEDRDVVVGCPVKEVLRKSASSTAYRATRLSARRGSSHS